MIKPSPDISKYADYRGFLRDRYLFLRLNDRKFSHRFINGKVGVKSSGWFGDLVAGRQRLHLAHVGKVAAAFKLDSRELNCLKALVLVENASTPEEISAAYEKWHEAKGIGQETVARDRFRFYDRWYFSVLRELLALHPGDPDPETLAKALDPAITPRQAREAATLLKRMDLSPSPGNGARGHSLPVLVKDVATRTRHWKRMMISMMRLGRRALERHDREARNFSGLTLTFSPEGMRRAGEEIAALRKRLLCLSERDKGRNRVYHCLFQLYPVSNPLEASHAPH